MSSDLYSPALAVAIGASVISLAVALLTRRSRLAVLSGVVAIIAVGVAATSHVLLGHAPGTASALGFVAFLGEHRALWVTLAVAIVAVIFARRRRHPEEDKSMQMDDWVDDFAAGVKSDEELGKLRESLPGQENAELRQAVSDALCMRWTARRLFERLQSTGGWPLPEGEENPALQLAVWFLERRETEN